MDKVQHYLDLETSQSEELRAQVILLQDEVIKRTNAESETLQQLEQLRCATSKLEEQRESLLSDLESAKNVVTEKSQIEERCLKLQQQLDELAQHVEQSETVLQELRDELANKEVTLQELQQTMVEKENGTIVLLFEGHFHN
jgi:ABC-type phosphate transport system auxiliary subunit